MNAPSSSKASNAQTKNLNLDLKMVASLNGLKYKKTPGFATTHGQDFEVTLAALLFLRGLNSAKEFQLATNVQGAGALDDVVFRAMPQEESSAWTTLFVQLKYKDRSWVNRNMLRNPTGDFSLAKYYQSYLEIKQAMSTEEREVLFDGCFDDCQFVIFTNAKADAKLGGVHCEDLGQGMKFLWSGSGSVFCFKTDKDMLECLGDQGGEFLSRLYMFCNQPNVKELKAIVRKEIKRLNKEDIGGLNIDRICDCYLDNVKVWWESRHEILHKGHDILQKTFNKVRLETCLEQTLKEYKLELDFEDVALLDLKMQVFQLNSPMVHVVSSEWSCHLTLNKLLELTESEPLVLLAQQLTANRPALLAKSQNVDKKRLIVITNDLGSMKIDVIIEILKSFQDTFSIVILSDGNSSISSELSERFESYKDDFKMSQMKPVSVYSILNKVVNLQGYEITLGTLLNNDYECLDEILSASLVVDILECVGHLTVGTSLPEGIENYVERTLEQSCVKASVFQALQGTVTVRITKSASSDSGLFLNALDFVNSLKDSQSFSHGVKSDICNKLVQSPFLSDGKDSEVFSGPTYHMGLYEFNCVGLRFGKENEVTALLVSPSKEASLPVRLLFASNDTKEEDVAKLSEFHQSIHFLSLKDGQLRWIHSHADVIKSIRNHIDENQISRLKPETVFDVEDRLVLVCAEPGMGKSTLMTRLAKKTKAALPHYIVVLIALNDHTKLFAQGKHTDSLEFLSIAAKMDSPLQRSLLKFALEVSGNVIVIADGFDEIAPTYVLQSCHFLSSLLKKTKARKIWMTSRNSVKHVLEKRLPKFSFKICEFDRIDQKKFLQKFWEGKSSERNVNECIDNLLKNSAKAIGDKERNFLGIPLQARILAEVYEGHVSVTDSVEKMELPHKLDLLSLMEQFMTMKLMIYIQDKLKIETNDPNHESILTMARDNFFDSHTKAALILILSDEDIKSMGLVQNLQGSLTFFNDIKLGVYKTGVIDEIVNEKPRFIHHAFAEYLVAKWISQHFASILNFVQSKIFIPDFTVIRYFFNGILCKDCVLHTAVLHEDVEKVKTLLQSEDVDVESQDVGGRTALHLAASLGASEDQEENRRRGEILDLIIGKTSDFKVVDDFLCGSPLRYADITRWWTAIDKLLCKTDHNEQLILTLKEKEDYKMLDTIFQEDLDTLLGLCLDNGLAVDHQYKGGDRGVTRLLVQACRKGSVNVASLLVARNANINIIEKSGQELMGEEESDDDKVPLITASLNGHLQIVKLLVAKYISSFTSPPSCEALYSATYHQEVSKFINMRDKDGMSAIHCAASEGKLDVITYLLSQGGDRQSRDNCNRTPLHLAALRNRPKILRVLLETLSDADRVAVIHSLDNNGNSVLHDAVWGDSVECLNILYEAGGRLYQADSDEVTLLMKAAREGKPEVVECLLYNFNADREGISLLDFINIKNKDGNTAMHNAVWGVSVECLNILYDAGGRLYQVDSDEVTLLMKAAREGKQKVVICLLDNFNADREGISLLDFINIKNKDGNTAMHNAVWGDSVECLNILYEAGGRLYQVDSDEDTPLIAAASEGNHEVVKWLLDNFNANRESITLVDFINLKNKNGETPMYHAVRRYSWTCLKLLFKSGGRLCHLGLNRETPLMTAVRVGHHDVVKWLLDNFIEDREGMSLVVFMTMKDKDGNTAMHHAANATVWRFSLKCIEHIFAAGGKLYEVNCAEETPLMKAVIKCKQDVVKWLLDNFSAEREGINLVDYINMKDKYGNTAVYQAVMRFSWPCVKLLVEAGGKLHQVDSDEETPLMRVSIETRQEVAKWLLENVNEEREGRTEWDTTRFWCCTVSEKLGK